MTVKSLRLQMAAYIRAEIIEDLNFEVLGSYSFRSQYSHYFRPSSVMSGWSSNDEGRSRGYS